MSPAFFRVAPLPLSFPPCGASHHVFRPYQSGKSAMGAEARRPAQWTDRHGAFSVLKTRPRRRRRARACLHVGVFLAVGGSGSWLAWQTASRLATTILPLNGLRQATVSSEIRRRDALLAAQLPPGLLRQAGERRRWAEEGNHPRGFCRHVTP